ncbi:MAG: hypothetical protein DMD51_02190 [Gemmatimonadetes bacterium]|nr:MAG: hypothetical protein DMD32_05220 [Gemmatimonadota bacterium]PYP27623.1 MAG: hypothetical protein DMD51_02190 [Gemmatimonadota bacterium]
MAQGGRDRGAAAGHGRRDEGAVAPAGARPGGRRGGRRRPERPVDRSAATVARGRRYTGGRGGAGLSSGREPR